MADTIDTLQDAMLKAIRDAKEAKRLYDIRLQERIAYQKKVDDAFHEWEQAKRRIQDCVTALESLVGAKP